MTAGLVAASRIDRPTRVLELRSVDLLVDASARVYARRPDLHLVLTIEDTQSTRTRVAAARRRVETDLSFDQRMRAVEATYDELMRTNPPPASKVESSSCA